MVKGLISRLDLVTCAVKHTTLLTSQHWHTRSRTRNPLHCVPLLHPTVTGTTVPYLYLQHSSLILLLNRMKILFTVTSVPNVPVWSQEEEAIWSAPGGMSEVRLWCRCCLVLVLVLGWCLSYGFSNGNKEEKYLCRVWAAAAANPGKNI